MLYDLNVPWSSTSTTSLERTISFLSEHYTVLALTHTITTTPAQINNPIPRVLPFPKPQNLTLLRRCTLIISDSAQNHRLPALAQAYDLLALRPTTEAAFKAACTTIEHHSLISLDLTARYPFHFRPGAFKTARARGIKFEICYAQAVQDGGTAPSSSGSAIERRRNFISNVLAVVRATGGRGLVVSSEAKSVLGVRAPADVANLLAVWGVPREWAKDAVTVSPRSVVVNEGIRRTGFRGIIDLLDAVQEGEEGPREERIRWTGQSQKRSEFGNENGRKKNKVKHEDGENGDPQDTLPISKRQAKRMKLAAREGQNGTSPKSIQDGSLSGKDATHDTPSTTKNKSKT